MKKKSFFREPSVSKICHSRAPIEARRESLIELLLNVEENRYLVLEEELIPERFYGNPRKFLKHGPMIPLKRYSNSKIAKEDKRIPLIQRVNAFERARENNRGYIGYSFKPVVGVDKKTRRVALPEILKGARLFAYVHQRGIPKKIIRGVYEDAKRVKKEGASVLVEVPSTRKKARRYVFRIHGIPVEDCPEKFLIPNRIYSDHICEGKRFRELRYNYEHSKEDSRDIYICQHEIAGIFGVIDYFWNERQNLLPLEFCPISIPSRKLSEIYKRLSDSFLVRKNGKLEKPNEAERAVILYLAVKELGHNETLFCKSTRDGNLSDYDWNLRI